MSQQPSPHNAFQNYARHVSRARRPRNNANPYDASHRTAPVDTVLEEQSYVPEDDDAQAELHHARPHDADDEQGDAEEDLDGENDADNVDRGGATEEGENISHYMSDVVPFRLSTLAIVSIAMPFESTTTPSYSKVLRCPTKCSN